MSDAAQYHWFGKDTVEKLAAQLAAGNVQRLEVRGVGHDMTLHVIRFGEAAAVTPLNESFPCPPICP